MTNTPIGGTFVLDSSAMLAYLKNEPGWPLVAGILGDVTSMVYDHSVNLLEVRYNFGAPSIAGNSQKAAGALAQLLAAGVQERSDNDEAFFEDVALVIAERCDAMRLGAAKGGADLGFGRRLRFGTRTAAECALCDRRPKRDRADANGGLLSRAFPSMNPHSALQDEPHPSVALGQRLSVADFAAAHGYSVRTVKRYIQNGKSKREKTACGALY